MTPQGVQNRLLISEETMQYAKLPVKAFPGLVRDAWVVHNLRSQRAQHAAIAYFSGTVFLVTTALERNSHRKTDRMKLLRSAG
jgi:hypothetical protein